MRPPHTLLWRERVERFSVFVRDIAQKARAGNVPFVVIYIPDGVQELLLSEYRPLPGINRYS
jgi:hypothetical protein